MSEFDLILDTPPLHLAVEEMVAMDLDADLAEIQKPIIPNTPTFVNAYFKIF